MADPELMPPPAMRVAAPKPRMTIYYALLIIALGGMLTSCIFLYMVVRTFGGFGAVQGRVSAVERSQSIVHHEGHEATKARITSVPFESFVVPS